MEFGDFPGAPHVRCDENGMFMERYILVCGDLRMAPDWKVLDYFRYKSYVRAHRRITLVKVPVDAATCLLMLRREPVPEPIYEPIRASICQRHL